MGNTQNTIEGSSITPTEEYPKLAEALVSADNSVAHAGAPFRLFFKREDLHPLGSHKGRSIPHMIDVGIADGIRHFAISSSGNAALAAALYVQQLNEKHSNDSADSSQFANPINLEIYVGKNIATSKLTKLQSFQNEYIRVSIHERPLQTLFARIQDPSIRGLRQSSDDIALVGYQSLAQELSPIPNLSAVFIGSSSGTTAQALAHYFAHHKATNTPAGVEVHIVQTSSCHPISEAFSDTVEETSEVSIADAIVDKTALRKDALTALITKTGGSGWIVDNASIRAAQDLTKKYTGLSISTNSALSVAGVMNALYTGKKWTGSVVCIIAGV